jgi:TIR domain
MANSGPASTGRIFVSYRREETAYPAGWLFDRLSEHFGGGQIFKDVDSIELGDDFIEEINTAVGSCDVLLALIGEQWLTITDEEGRRRLDDPKDFVRLEVEAALDRKVRVIPILIDGATMPRAEELPPSLARLVRRQALDLSPSRFEFDTSRLIHVLEATLEEVQARPSTKQSSHGTRGEREPSDQDLRARGGELEAAAWRRRRSWGLAIMGALVGAFLLFIGVRIWGSGSEEAQGDGVNVPTATGDTTAAGTSGETVIASFETGSELWGPDPDVDHLNPGTTRQATDFATDGLYNLQIETVDGGWFVGNFDVDFRGKSTVSLDIRVVSGDPNVTLAVKFGDEGIWCQSDDLDWTGIDFTAQLDLATATVEDETQENLLGDACNTLPESDLAELRAVLVFLNAHGSYRVDNVRVD